jgi:hypothetical protein
VIEALMIKKLDRNRVNFAKLQIFRYVEDLYTAVSDLLNPKIELLMNMEGHGLGKEELVEILYEMFSTHMLVAKTEARGFFTPCLAEIQSALEEEKDSAFISNNTFYGLTTGAMEMYLELKVLYQTPNNPNTQNSA